MAKFKINEGLSDEKVVQASSFTETGSFVVFSTYDEGQIFALPTKEVRTIEQINEAE